MRPIMADYNSATYNISKSLVSIIEPLTGRSKAHVKNSFDVFNKLHNVSIQNNESMFSFDAISLFTMMPTNFIIDIIIKNKLKQTKTWKRFTSMSITTIITLIKLCVKGKPFRFENSYFKQIDGCGMGIPLSPVLANISMDYIVSQTRLYCRKQKIPIPRVLFKYVDDIWGITQTDSIDNLLAIFNSVMHEIQFECVKESNNFLPFLDLGISRNTDGTLNTSVFIKPTDAQCRTHWSTYSSFLQKVSIISCFVIRAIRLSSDNIVLDNEIKRIRNMFLHASYPPKIITFYINKTINNYNNQSINNHKYLPRKSDDLFHSFCVVPYIDGLYQQLKKITIDYNVRLISKPGTKFHSSFKHHISTEQHMIVKFHL